MDQGSVEDCNRRSRIVASLNETGQNGHEHHWRLWQPGDSKDLRFFEGSIRKMQSIIVTPGSIMTVRRFGAESSRYYVDNRHVASVDGRGGTYTIVAHAEGSTLLHAHNSREKCVSALFIHVRRLVSLPVMFLFLKDSSVHDVRGHWEQRAEIVRVINEIYQPQLAVRVTDITPGDMRNKPAMVDMDLGNPIQFSLLNSQTVHSRVSSALPAAVKGIHPKFVFVRDFDDPQKKGLQKQDLLYICDGIDPKKVARLCAHELAHLLTDQIKEEFEQEGHTTERSHLLNSLADGVRLGPFSTSYSMYLRALAAGGTTS